MRNGRLSNNNDGEYEEKKGQNRLYKKKIDRQNGHQVVRDVTGCMSAYTSTRS